jgi:type II secretory pathway pseudopilin PulG
MVQPKHNTLMHLQGQQGQHGYAMAALLVALAVMSVLMSAVLPAWRHQAQREKEAELIFRGEQYVRAISLWERRNGPGARPPNVDVLVQQRYLRKKYQDPMAEDGEFQLLFAGVNPPPGAGRTGCSERCRPDRHAADRVCFLRRPRRWGPVWRGEQEPRCGYPHLSPARPPGARCAVG